ncbi:unnamed protein product [Paramecium octaurelia]|uniref:Uncharacterized protein n=1 Tax=Paramecium octaurelia TaxID=43137 RepID=A0A8S1UWF6_PAROT|nr:unnamed protein product [Paramecium octaurelia]
MNLKRIKCSSKKEEKRLFHIDQIWKFSCQKNNEFNQTNVNVNRITKQLSSLKLENCRCLVSIISTLNCHMNSLFSVIHQKAMHTKLIEPPWLKECSNNKVMNLNITELNYSNQLIQGQKSEVKTANIYPQYFCKNINMILSKNIHRQLNPQKMIS